MKDHVLVTGASGFIGRYVTDALLQRGYEVTALVRKKIRSWIYAPQPWKWIYAKRV